MNITFPAEVERYIAQRVQSGAFASESEVVEAAVLRQIQEEQWLEQRVVEGLQGPVTPLTRVSLRATYSVEDFDYTPARNARNFALVPGVEFKPLALISGSATVGIRRFEPENPMIQDFTGVIAHANLAYTLQGFTRFRFSADRNLAFSYSQAAPYYVTNEYGIGVDRHIGGKFDVTGGLDWLVDRRNALLRGPEDVAGWADGLSTLERDACLRARIGAQGRRDLLERYTWKQRARAIMTAVSGDSSQAGLRRCS
jgi:putative addiction module CopG family antidote